MTSDLRRPTCLFSLAPISFLGWLDQAGLGWASMIEAAYPARVVGTVQVPQSPFRNVMPDSDSHSASDSMVRKVCGQQVMSPARARHRYALAMGDTLLYSTRGMDGHSKYRLYHVHILAAQTRPPSNRGMAQRPREGLGRLRGPPVVLTQSARGLDA